MLRLFASIIANGLHLEKKILFGGAVMKISYRKLWVLLAEHEISKIELRENTGIATGTMTKLNKGEEVSLNVLLRICEFLNCDIGDICEAVEE